MRDEPTHAGALSADVVRSIERGLAMIAALGVPGPGRTATDLARELRLTRAGTYRVLSTLRNLGYVRTSAGRFMLTPRVLELGYRQWSGLGLADVAKPHLGRLLEETCEACSVSILDGDTIVCVARAAPVRLIGVAAEVGRRLPAYATAQGRVLLSSLSPSDLSLFLDSADLRPLTRSTIVRRGELRAALAAVRRRGWALVDEELEPGVRSVAVPIADGRDIVAAMGIVVDAQRVSVATLRGELLPRVRAAADRIETDLALTYGRASHMRPVALRKSHRRRSLVITSTDGGSHA
jgi:IclR family transcriptional regulator, pca regulon regulatory protein